MAPTRKYTIYEASDILHQVGSLHLSTLHLDYGTGERFSSTEVHTLSYVVDNPGITVTQLAMDNGKTKGAISQMIKKLAEKGLLRRELGPAGDRTTHLYATDAGRELHLAHKQYDTSSFGRTYKALIELHSADEVNAALSVLETWLSLRRRLGCP